MLNRRFFLKVLFLQPLFFDFFIKKSFYENKKFRKKKSGNMYWILSYNDN